MDHFQYGMADPLNLRTLHQKAHAAHAVPLVSVQPKGQYHFGWQWFGMAKPNAVYGLTTVLQLECQVLFTDQALRHHRWPKLGCLAVFAIIFGLAVGYAAREFI